MLQSIRDRTQGWIAGIIIGLVILSFALWGIHSYVAGFGGNDTIAKVNSVEISKRQLATSYERLRRQMQVNNATGGLLPDNIESTLKRRALDSLINLQVLRQGAVDESFKVSARQVDNYLETMPEFQVNGQFSTTRLQELLTASLYSPMDFLNLIETSLLIDQPRLGVILTAFSLPDEIDSAIALINQEREVQYIQLPLDYFAKQKMDLSDREIQAYYDQHQDQFKTPENVVAEYIELSVKDLKNAIQPTEDETANFYKDNVNTYTLPAQWTLEKILLPLPEGANDQQVADTQEKAKKLVESIKNGADFTKLAQLYPAADSVVPAPAEATPATTASTSAPKAPAPAPAAPDTSKPVWVTLAQLPSELQKPVTDLRQGKMTDPIRTSNGFLIVKATGYKSALIQGFDQVKDKVKDAVAKQHAEEKFADMKDKLANLTYEHPESLEPAAKALGLTVKTTQAFTQAKGASDDVTNLKNIRDAAFSDDVLHSQNNSDVILTSPESVVVIRDKSHTPATLLSAETVHPQIVEALQKSKAEEKAAAVADEIAQKLKSGASPEQIAQQYSFAWVKEGYLGRYSTKIDSAILYTAFRLPRPEAAKGMSYGTVKLPTGYAVVAVNAVRDGSLEGNKEQYDVFNEQLQNSIGTMEYQMYASSLTANSKITINGETQEDKS
jgi:peptidyl-prolyl cis-trans isomerase D